MGSYTMLFGMVSGNDKILILLGLQLWSACESCGVPESIHMTFFNSEVPYSSL